MTVTEKRLAEVKKKMLGSLVTQFKRSRYDRIKCPTVKVMASYIMSVFPELTVNIRETSQTKHTKTAGCRYFTGGGTREYSGYQLTVFSKGAEEGKLYKQFSHDTTETYRTNHDVAKWILDREGINSYDYDVADDGTVYKKDNLV